MKASTKLTRIKTWMMNESDSTKYTSEQCIMGKRFARKLDDLILELRRAEDYNIEEYRRF